MADHSEAEFAVLEIKKISHRSADCGAATPRTIAEFPATIGYRAQNAEKHSNAATSLNHHTLVFSLVQT
tara:strand:- start:265 stop:471 length:207 start_codon:yes stop_codon:yes gene_type:complete